MSLVVVQRVHGVDYHDLLARAAPRWSPANTLAAAPPRTRARRSSRGRVSRWTSCSSIGGRARRPTRVFSSSAKGAVGVSSNPASTASSFGDKPAASRVAGGGGFAQHGTPGSALRCACKPARIRCSANRLRRRQLAGRCPLRTTRSLPARSLNPARRRIARSFRAVVQLARSGVLEPLAAGLALPLRRIWASRPVRELGRSAAATYGLPSRSMSPLHSESVGEIVSLYAGPVNQFLGPMSGRGNFGLSAWHFEQLTVIIDSDFRTSHA